ncbi:MAG: HDIG domain-containing protein [Bacteroidetes bacterium]|nr:HDIG domain-containing protein [Bacteroidota bacterium]MDA0879640.1 HDIG domain-containing protein [Bacteroidota bacterium]MDA1115715.1 HDIG domain-containing protein [Bacteroidota bacterium]
MSLNINYLYKINSLFYKAILYASTVAVIVYVFPKKVQFFYDYENGQPWQSENLYAPFDFAIKKSAEQIQFEQNQAFSQTPVYLDRDSGVWSLVENQFNAAFETFLVKSTDSGVENALRFTRVRELLVSLYDIGVLESDLGFSAEKLVVVLDRQKQIAESTVSQLVTLDRLSEWVDQEVDKRGLTEHKASIQVLLRSVIRPNLSLNATLTQQANKESAKMISEVRGRVGKGTIIIAKGELATTEKINILNSLKSEFESQVGSVSSNNWILFAYTILTAIALLMLLLFIRKYRSEIYENNTKVTFILFNVVVVVLLTAWAVQYGSTFVYLVPICVLPLILKTFFDARLGLFTHVITVLLLGFVVEHGFEFVFLQIIAGIVTILTVSELYKRVNLFISVGQITLIYLVTYFAFFMIQKGNIEELDLEPFGFFALNGLATLFVLPLIYAYEKMFGLVSDVSLLELTDTNSLLLKELSNKAPGTFHHSLNVANLAEAVANEVQANAMLVRVGALYHDIGKMKNPTYFIENQSTGINPHNELEPKDSAQIIINHVIDGIELAKKHNLPDRIIDFIRTHHGTTMTYYFYSKEKAKNPMVRKQDFVYPGPKPFSKETAILMMCDSVEAASKSMPVITAHTIDQLVERIIGKQIETDQFLNANITFREIMQIKKVLKHKLANIYHLRIEYPE